MPASRTFTYPIAHYFFCLLLIGLPFSKAVVSIAFGGLILISVYLFFGNIPTATRRGLIFTPVLIFLALGLSLFYSNNFATGLKILSSNIELIALPFIFWILQEKIMGRFFQYLNLLIAVTVTAASFTLLFFMMPNECTQTITTAIPLLQDYAVPEKEFAFGAYSPFMDRLQFSYLLGGCLLLQFWISQKDNFSLKIGFWPLLKLTILLVALIVLGARGAQISFLMASSVWLIGWYFYLLFPKLTAKIGAFASYGVLVGGLFLLLIVLPLFVYRTIPAVKIRYDQMRWEIGTFQDDTFKNYDYKHFTSIRRLLSWKNSWSIIQRHPILGVGIGDYQTMMEKEFAKDKLGFPVNTQNQYLYYWTSSGILGCLALLFLLGCSLAFSLKQKDLPFKLLGVSFLLFYSFIFLFDAPLNFQMGAMTFLTLFGLLVVKGEIIK